MTGVILANSFARYSLPRSSAKVMEYVSRELKEDCPCSLELDEAKNDVAASLELYGFPHGAG